MIQDPMNMKLLLVELMGTQDSYHSLSGLVIMMPGSAPGYYNKAAQHPIVVAIAQSRDIVYNVFSFLLFCGRKAKLLPCCLPSLLLLLPPPPLLLSSSLPLFLFLFFFSIISAITLLSIKQKSKLFHITVFQQ